MRTIIMAVLLLCCTVFEANAAPPVLQNTPGPIPVSEIGTIEPSDPLCGVWRGSWVQYGQPITVVISAATIAYGVDPFKDGEGNNISQGYIVFPRENVGEGELKFKLKWRREEGKRVFVVKLSYENEAINARWKRADGEWDTAILRRQ